jgi:uncharacterized protein YbjT (DUF2867 family)
MHGFKRTLVTGATGNIGSEVVKRLRAQGTPCCAAVTDVHRYRQAEPGVEAVAFNFHDPLSFAAALDGVDSMFLVRPPGISSVVPTLNRFITQAVQAGVKHVVFTSVAGADTNLLLPHHRVEKHLAQAATHHTMLRPTFFADNLGTAYRDDIRDDHRLYVPAGQARVAFIDTRDIAAVVARVAADPRPHVNKAYTLTGPAHHSFAEVAEMLSVELGRNIRYEAASVLGYVRHLHRRRLPLPFIAVQTILHVDLRRGHAGRIDPTLPTLLGREALSMVDHVHHHRKRWLATAGPDGKAVIDTFRK